MDLKTRGNAKYASGDFEGAARLYTQALLEDPHLAAALANRCQCFLQLGRYAEALDDAENALKGSLDQRLRVKVLYRKAQAEQNLQQPWLETVKHGLALDPSNSALLDLSERTWQVQAQIPEQDLQPAHEIMQDTVHETQPQVQSQAGPTFHPPSALTYASIINSTRVPSPAAFAWWETVPAAQFQAAHRGQVEPSTLAFFRKMNETHNAGPLLAALEKCPGYSIADMF